MAKLRRILALVLVMAMTFSMLPVFASAEEVVSEVAAVETVEAPVAEAPAAEAPAEAPAADVPAVEAPVAEIPVAVEDVAEIPAETPADVPVVEAIETVAAETVAALQDVAESDVAKLVTYDESGNVTAETGYATLKDAYAAAGAINGLCEVVMLKDVTYVLTSGSSSTSGYINGTTGRTKAGYQSWDLTNNRDAETEVKGFWLDMAGHTVTLRCVNSSTNNKGYYLSAFFLGDSIPLNVKNGTFIYKYSRTTQAAGFNLVSCGYNGTSSATYAIGTAEDLYTPSITLKDVNFYRVNNSGDLAGGGTYSNAGPVITVAMLASNINIIRSDIFSMGSYAINYKRNTLRAVAPDGTTDTTHNLTIQDSRIGTANGERAAIYVGALDVGTGGGLELNSSTLNVTLKGAVQFIGSSPVVQITEDVTTPMTLNFPQAEQVTASTTVITAPDVNSLVAISATSNTVPAYLDPVEYNSYLYLDTATHTHRLEKHEAVAATLEADGVKEHYTCALCNAYLESDKTTVTTPDALIIKRANMSDAELAAIGVVAVSIDPDGTKKYYDGNNAINDAYKYGATTWTEAGGVVKLVCDYTYVNATSESYTSPFLNTGANTMSELSHNYKNADADEARFEGLGLKGFWFDLGGHTLTLRTGKSFLYTRYSVPINIRNGRILYQDTAKATASYAMLKLGHTSGGAPGYDANGVYCPEVTFDGVTYIRVPYDKGNTLGGTGAAAGPMFWISMLQSKINIVNSTLINNDGNVVINYNKALDTSTAAGAAAAKSPYRHEINLRGNVVLGRTSEGAIISTSNAPNGTEENPIAGEGIFLNVADGADVTYLGTSIANLSDPELAAASSIPTGYVASAEKYVYRMPDMTTAATESSMAGVDDAAEDSEYTKLEKQTDVASKATFTPNGGEEGAVTSLSAAFQAWEQNGYSGTITLKENLSADDAKVVMAAVGTGATFYRTYKSGATVATPMTALYTISAEANDKDLTFDLGGNTLSLDSGFLAMDNALEGFTLTIQNGTVSSIYEYPIVVLKGADNDFNLVNATLENTNETATFPYVINDSRYANSYSVITGSTLTSANAAAIALMATKTNKNDASLLYYIKGSTLNAKKTEYAPAAISTLACEESRVLRSAYNVILDGTTVNGTVENLNTTSFVNVTAPEAEALPVATVSYGTIANIACADVHQAVKVAELFGRNTTAASKVTLMDDANIESSVSMGVANADSTFTLDLNGKALTGEGLLEANGGAGTKVTMNVIGELGGDATKVKFFAHADALDYTAGNSYVIEKGRYFTKYSLNLEDSVSINLYTDGENGNADSVTYVHDGNDYKAAAGNLNEWVVTTLAAKDMGKTVDAYAVKTDGTTTYLDFSKGMSVKGYTESDPAAGQEEAVAEALNNTLDTMLVYGEYAKRFFAGNADDISTEDMNALIGKDAPVVDTSNLDDTPRDVSEGIPDHSTNSAETQGYWGTSAVLEDNISIKMYFYGAMFDGATAKVKYGDGGFEDATLETQDSTGFKFIKSAVAAKDFDTAITVALYEGETLIGTVTDSVSSYTSRIAEGNSAYKLAQALRAYGADAKRYDAAKNGN